MGCQKYQLAITQTIIVEVSRPYLRLDTRILVKQEAWHSMSAGAQNLFRSTCEHVRYTNIAQAFTGLPQQKIPTLHL